MSRRMVVATLLVALGLVLVGFSLAHGDEGNWAEGLFTENSHDFGPVPRGAKVRHPFVLTNRTNEAISILSIIASCGCTSGRASASVVPPGQVAAIEAEMDTRNFVGPKATTLTVSLVTASGRQGEMKFGVRSNILSDIVLNPGTIDFGTVAKGQSPRLTLTIERIGSPSWRATRILASPNLVRHVTASLVETNRSGDDVLYTLSVALKPDAPAGALRDEIRIMTNDPESPVVPVLVTATLQGTLTAQPSVLDLGRVSSPAGVQGRYLISASVPFAIQAVEGTGEGFHLDPADKSRKKLHVLTLSYRPAEGKLRGDLHRKFRIRTDLPGEAPLDLKATLRVEP